MGKPRKVPRKFSMPWGDGQVVEEVPFVDLGSAYKLVGGFEERFPHGVPSLREATRFEVPGDWTFGADVTVVGPAVLGDQDGPATVAPGTTLG